MQKIAVAVAVVSVVGCAPLTQPPLSPPQQIEALAPRAPFDAAAPLPNPETAGAAESPAALAATPELELATSLDTGRVAALPEEPDPTIWRRISAGFALPAIDNALVREWESWYAQRPDYVDRMIERSRHFLFHVTQEVEKRGMPLEIALLPMVESAYNPMAYSKAHASGMWQFIPSTGKHYGLRQSWWYDGRRDVLEATEAALDYLEKLHGLFGDWQLALAAYNCGEGAVGRAIERNRAKGLPTDYESLVLPTETREYVPKLIAVKNIISDPARFGLDIEAVPNEPYFETVEVEHHIDVTLAARLAGMDEEAFRFLNPAHKKPVIKAGEAERIVLPKDKISVFRANLGKHAKPFVSWKVVTLRRGDKPHRVATSHGMTLAELREVNGVRGRKRIRSGQLLLVRAQGGVRNPQLPDIVVIPVSLSRAVKAARTKAAARKGRTVTLRRAPSRAGKTVRVRSVKPAAPASKQARKARQRASRR